jgi:hypothetical protein
LTVKGSIGEKSESTALIFLWKKCCGLQVYFKHKCLSSYKMSVQDSLISFAFRLV